MPEGRQVHPCAGAPDARSESIGILTLFQNPGVIPCAAFRDIGRSGQVATGSLLEKNNTKY
jgi:hypothetical protein